MKLSSLLKGSLLGLQILCSSATAIQPMSTGLEARQDSSSYWMSSIKRQGVAAFGDANNVVFRNVKDFGAVGDGSTDDTDAINKAVHSGPNRCLDHCDSRTNAPALVYFPAGTYVVSKPIVQSYYTQFVGDATNMPVLKASPDFAGMAVIDANPYYPNEDAQNWYINQNNFFRQIRNFKIDLTAMPVTSGAGIHWQVAQATSLQNIVFEMSPDTSEKNVQKGVFIENGSGGFMTDLTFNGGGYGIDIGSQQFTLRNMTFNNCRTAIHMIWNWQFMMHGMKINGAQVGFDMTSDTVDEIKVGSMIVIDSKISNTKIGINSLYDKSLPGTNNTLILDNVDMSENVPTAIYQAKSKTAILEGNQAIASFAQGKQYSGDSSGSYSGKAIQATQKRVTKSSSLMKNGEIVTRTKPQYEDLPSSSFVSVKSAGAKGDGKADDTHAIQSIFDSAKEGQVIYFDHGAYRITDTVKVPKNIKITGEMWPMLMATGDKFSNEAKPIPMLQVGEPGDVGDVEMSDLIIETQGPAPGAILMQWNMQGTEGGSAGMWDVHFRVGGTAGSELQSDKCSKTPKQDTQPNPECVAAFMLLHITQTGSAYVENCWFWVADHELDINNHNQINLYNGRGVLIESQNPVWMWGTASEHSQMYNYQLTNARNVFMGVIQTETAYMQGNPDALVPFKANDGYFDPDFASCNGGSSDRCARTWGLRVMNSSDVYVYGGGLYSFFDNYGQTCVKENNCQDNMISIEDSNVHLFGISTKASVNMLTNQGKSVALDKDNRNTFCAAIAKFETSGGPTDQGISGGGNGGESGSGSGGSGSDSDEKTTTLPSTLTLTSTSTGTATVTWQGPQATPSNPQPTGGSGTGGSGNGGSDDSGTQPVAQPTGQGQTTDQGNPAPTPAPTSGGEEAPVVVTITKTVTAEVNCESGKSTP